VLNEQKGPLLECYETVCRMRHSRLHEVYSVTEDEYLSAIRWCGLTPTRVPGVYLDRDGMPRSVPNPKRYSAEERAEIAARIRQSCKLEG
jgi:hypothetical protein